MIKITKLLSAFAFALIATHISAIGPAYIKDTYLPVAPEFRHVSPINGAMYWEGNVIRKYYGFGIQAPKAHKNDWLPGGDGPYRLVHALFNIVQGSFGISQNPSYPAFHISARTIAMIVATLEKHRLAKSPLTIDEIEQVILTDPDFKQSIEQTKRDFTKTNDPKYDVRRLGPSFQTGKRIRKEPGYQRVRELAQAIVDAHNTSLEIYPPYIAYSILTAFMYRKAVNKVEFLDYFAILNQELESEIISTVITIAPEEWLADNYSDTELPRIKEALTEWLHPEQPDMQILTGKLYEDAVYGQIIERFYKSSMPKQAGYTRVTFEGIEFPDCAETAIRNLCNILLYDPVNGLFDPSKLPAAKLSPDFAEFYQRNPNATNVEQQSVHQEWINVIQKKPWVAYEKMVDQRTKEVANAPDDTNGFIIIPEKLRDSLPKDGNTVKIANQDYIPIDGLNKKGFEVQPSIRNIIILLNQFFGLNLFENLEKDFLNPDFNATYLPILAEKFEKLEDLQFDRDFDSKDYQQEIHLDFGQFSIKLMPDHAELTVSYQHQDIINLSPILIQHVNKVPNIFIAFQYTQLLSIYSLSVDQLVQVKSIPSFSFIYFLNLFDNNTLTNLFSQYLYEKISDQKNPLIQKAAKNLSYTILKILAQQADLAYLDEAIERLQSPIDPTIGIFIHRLAQEKISSGNIKQGISIFKKLVEKGYEPTFKIATELAIKAVSDPETFYDGIQLFEKLVATGYKPALQPATEAATKAVSSISTIDLMRNKKCSQAYLPLSPIITLHAR